MRMLTMFLALSSACTLGLVSFFCALISGFRLVVFLFQSEFVLVAVFAVFFTISLAAFFWVVDFLGVLK